MRRKSHVRFLGEGAAVTSPPYPTMDNCCCTGSAMGVGTDRTHWRLVDPYPPGVGFGHPRCKFTTWTKENSVNNNHPSGVCPG